MNTAIRLIGDPILQAPGLVFPEKPSAEELKELQRQIQLAKHCLIESGGAGIAANQCAALARPYRFAIVGVFQNSAEHLVRVAKRYPGVSFPPAMVMINPRLLSQSEEQQTFSHGCLSVPGRLRGEMLSPFALEVEYLTLTEKDALIQRRHRAEGIAAVVLQHELNHILWGKTYVDCCLVALPAQELEALTKLVRTELESREREPAFSASVADAGFYPFIQIERGSSRLKTEIFKKCLNESLDTDTLRGLESRTLHTKFR